MIMSYLELKKILQDKKDNFTATSENTGLGDYDKGFIAGIENCIAELSFRDNNFKPEIPSVCIYVNQNTAVLYCTPELMQFLMKMQNEEGDTEISLVDVSRLYLEIKKLVVVKKNS